MLWNASAINGYAIEASDGRLGAVSDLLFEDVGWAVRWLVVNTGHWLPGRKVLLPLSALGRPDRGSRHFPVKLTMQQVKDSPDIDTDQPVSRRIEAHVYNHYGWDPYWGTGVFPIGNAMVMPFLAPAVAKPFVPPRPLAGAEPRDPAGADAQPDDAEPEEGDPHLRSIAAVTGYHLQATDGEIGHVEDFLVDDAGWSIRYIVVDTRNWWPGKKVLISPRSVREIDWPNRLIHLDVNRQKVKDSPELDPAMTVDGAYEEKHRAHYGHGGPEGSIQPDRR